MKKLTKAILLATAVVAMKCASPAGPEVDANTALIEVPEWATESRDQAKWDTDRVPAQAAPAVSASPVEHPKGWLPLVETEVGYNVGGPGSEWVEAGWQNVYLWTRPQTSIEIMGPFGWVGVSMPESEMCGGPGYGAGVDNGGGGSIFTYGTCRPVQTTSIRENPREIPNQEGMGL
jgi:hypothetical protein